MCGIAGIFSYKGSEDIFSENSEINIRRMINVLRHRGPDQTGFFINGNIALGHSRLSIIDLEGGNQPVANEENTLQVIFNGEIFNFIELRDFLENKGHVFRTLSDTEVIVHLYEEYGRECFKYLNGQFAIALYDITKKELILARDRVGIRPLYYYESDKGIVFASEIKAIFQYPDIERSFDYKGLNQVFTFWTTVPPCTVFKNIKELPPGCVLRSDSNASSVDILRYWHLEFPPNGEWSGLHVDKIHNILREKLFDSVSMRLRADVPVASYLSGGLDSSIISSMVSKYFNNDLMTFSVGFDDPAYDENRYQNEMQALLLTHHKSVNVDSRSIHSVLADVIWHGEMPIFRTSPAPLYILSGLVHENNIKVVLTGEGADEIFGGYNIFREEKIRRFWSRRSTSLHRKKLLTRLYPYISREDRTSQFWYHFFGRNLEDTESPFYSHLIRWKNTEYLKNYLSSEIREKMNHYDAYEDLLDYCSSDIMKWHPLSRGQYLETILFMSGYLLSSQGDRMMMANSVEGRFPFLDHKLIEFAASIPPENKIYGLNEKFILKKAFQDIVPESILRREKQPYRAPIAEVFKPSTDENDFNHFSENQLKETCLFDKKGIDLLNVRLLNNSLSPRDEMALTAIISLNVINSKFLRLNSVP